MDLEVTGTMHVDEKTKERLMDSVKEEVRKEVLDNLTIAALSSYIKKTYDVDDFYTLMSYCFHGENGIADTVTKMNNDDITYGTYLKERIRKLEAMSIIISI